MALSGSTNYNNALTSSIKEEWLFEFRNHNYDADSFNVNQVIRLAIAEVTPGAVSNDKYHEFITNSPIIRESIDLSNSTSSVGNITLTCVNGTLDNHSNATLAAEIYGGSRRYINHEVIVYSRVGGYTEQIFQGRLKEVKIDGVDTLSIMIAVHDPIKDISIPQYQSKAGNYFPVFYGTGTPETSTVSVPDFVDISRVFPVQVDTLNNDVYNCLFHQAEDSDARLHYPVKDSFDAFGVPRMCPLDDTAGGGTANETYDDYEGESNNTNKNVMRTDLDLHRSYKIRPQTVTDAVSATGITVANAGNAYDVTGASTVATFTGSLNTDVNASATYTFTDIPKEEHTLQTFKLFVNYQVASYSSSNGTLTIKITVGLKHDEATPIYKTIEKTANVTVAAEEFDLIDTNDFSNATKKTPEEVTLKIEFSNVATDDGGTANSAVVTVKDVYFTIATKIVDDNDTDELLLANSSAVTSVKKLYTGSDGFDRSWGVGEVSNIAEMHRDLIHRFAGITTTSVFQSNGTTANLLAEALDDSETGVDIDDGSVFSVNDAIRIDLEEMLITSISSNTLTVTRGQNGTSAATHSDNATISKVPYNFTKLNTARANWKCKYWLQKPTQMKTVLKKIQYEGGFIFRFKTSDNTPQYIYLATNPSVVHTISKNDITNMRISVTPFESLVTKREVKYEVNPINDKNFREITCTDTTNNPRSAYNIDTKENVKTDELKILRAAPGAANMGGLVEVGFANHYNAIEGNPKLIISTEIINPGSSGGSSYFYLMEVGDICAFSHTNQVIAPFGESFDGKKFIIVSLSRGIGSLKVTLREV